MYKYVIKRILLTIPVLLGAVFLVFTIMYLTPGDPGTLILGITAKPEDIAALNHKLGADLPFFEQFFNYLKGIILHFDFGTSYRSGKPVFDSILSRFPTTFQLALWSMLLSSVLGIALGIISAVKQYSVLDNALTTLAMLLSAMPGFWLGLMLMVLFALKLGWLPFGGVDTWQGYISSCNHTVVGSGSQRDASDTFYHAGDNTAGLYSYRPQQGRAGENGDLEACAAQRAAACCHIHGYEFWRQLGRRGHHRDGVWYAGRRHADR